jgi:Flp pilus assembly protein TadB
LEAAAGEKGKKKKKRKRREKQQKNEKKKAEILRGQQLEARKEKKRERFSRSAAGGKREDLFGFLRVAADRGERKKTAPVAGFFTGSLGVLALGLHSL